jgi:hypothetical protein
MKITRQLLLSLLVLGAAAATSAQTSEDELRDAARKHAGCANTYTAILERLQDNQDPSAKVTAEKLQSLHHKAAIALAGDDIAQRLMRSTKASLAFVVRTMDKTENALEDFYKRRVDTCTKHIADLTEEQTAQIEKLQK